MKNVLKLNKKKDFSLNKILMSFNFIHFAFIITRVDLLFMVSTVV